MLLICTCSTRDAEAGGQLQVSGQPPVLTVWIPSRFAVCKVDFLARTLSSRSEMYIASFVARVCLLSTWTGGLPLIGGQPRLQKTESQRVTYCIISPMKCCEADLSREQMLFLSEHLFPDVCGDGVDEQLCHHPYRKNSLSHPTLPGFHGFSAEPSFLPASVKHARKYSHLSCKNVFSSHSDYNYMPVIRD